MTPSCLILFNLFSANPRPYVSLTLSSPSPMLHTIMGCICIHLTMPICRRGRYKQDIRDQTENENKIKCTVTICYAFNNKSAG